MFPLYVLGISLVIGYIWYRQSRRDRKVSKAIEDQKDVKAQLKADAIRNQTKNIIKNNEDE